MSKVAEDYHAPVTQSDSHYARGPSAPGSYGNRKFYKPFVLRTLPLAILLVITLVLFGIVEFACQKLPHAENNGLVGSLRNHTDVFEKLNVRQILEWRTTIFTARQLDESGSQSPGVTPGEEIKTPTPTVTSVISKTSTTLTTIDGLERTIEVYYTSNWPDPLATSIASSAPPEGNWLQTGARLIPLPGVSPTPAPIPNVPSPNEPKPVDPSPVNNNPGTPNPINTATTIPVNQLPGTTNINGVPTTAGSTFNPVAFIPIATTTRDTLGNVVATTIPVAIDSAGSTIALASGSIHRDSTTTYVVVPTASAGAGSRDSTNGTYLFEFTEREYITGAFLPTVLAVLFAIPWALIDAAAKEMEPFYQLAAIGGTSARDSIALNYASTSMFVAPFVAFSRGHWVIFTTSILGLLSLVLAPIAVEAVFISLQGTCNSETLGIYCLPALSVFKPAARVLEALLLIMAVLAACLLYLTRSRKSGVLAEPVSLAGVAGLIHNQEFLNIVRDLPSHGKREKALLGLLPSANYTIGHYQNTDGTWGYGFMISRDLSTPYIYYGPNSSNINHDPSNDDIGGSRTGSFWTRVIRVGQVLGFLCFLLGVLVMIGFYRFSKAQDNSFGDFMNTQQFGPKFLFTTLGVIISQFWIYARGKIHRNEPYHSLATLASPPRKSMLTSPALAPITSIFTSIRLLSPLLILLDLSTICADALIITLANVPFSSTTTYQAWLICSGVSLGILGFMVFTVVVILVRISRFGAVEGGGEVPVTVVGKAVLMCGSGMLEKFDGLGEANGKERKQRIESWQKVYGIGRVRGVDGVVRRGIDFGEYIEGR